MYAFDRVVEFGTSIYWLGPHQIIFSRSQSLVQLFLVFSEHSKVSRRILLEFGSRWIITALLWRRHLLITSGIWTGSLDFGIRICLVIW